jgi:hypothetical protein
VEVAQGPRVAPEELIYTPEGAATVTLTAVYVPAGMVTFAATRFVSVCRRVSSKSVEGFDENTDTAPPLDGVSVIPIIGIEKLTTDVFVGGVSEMVRLRVALPPPPQFVVHAFFNPLQELSIKIAAIAMNKRDFFEFIYIPQDWIRQTAPDGPDGWESPSNTVAPAPNPERPGISCGAQLLTVR